jgi:uncharacterized membrane protein
MPNAISQHNPAINVGAAERIGSTVAGTALIFHALARPSFVRIAVALGGMALLQRGLTGNCGVYRALGVDTAHRDDGARQADGRDRVEAASEDSFPASDPPSWTPVTGPAGRH